MSQVDSMLHHVVTVLHPLNLYQDIFSSSVLYFKVFVLCSHEFPYPGAILKKLWVSNHPNFIDLPTYVKLAVRYSTTTAKMWLCTHCFLLVSILNLLSKYICRALSPVQQYGEMSHCNCVDFDFFFVAACVVGRAVLSPATSSDACRVPKWSPSRTQCDSFLTFCSEPYFRGQFGCALSHIIGLFFIRAWQRISDQSTRCCHLFLPGFALCLYMYILSFL